MSEVKTNGITTPKTYPAVSAFAKEIHPKTSKQTILYGTAGFRTKGIDLGYVLFRMGLLANLRARYKNATIGLMITASHNPEPDNGVKLIDPKGEMLESSWESIATKFANVPDNELQATIENLIHDYEIDMNIYPEVYIGKDTRPSSSPLARAAIDGILTLKGRPVEFGIITTPMLHYLVVCKNTKGAYGEPSEEGYVQKLTKAFKYLHTGQSDTYSPRLLFDGANGVGAKKIKAFQTELKGFLELVVFNEAPIGSGKLNHMCGADYVKVQQKPPEGLPIEADTHCVSVDGDADRVVYYFHDDAQKFHLLDGDRVATLITSYLMELVRDTELNLSIGLVQTAYANGASTDYILNTLKIPVACVETGVKHLHKRALQYDIGVYFEANGHGTIVYSDNVKTKLAAIFDGSENANAKAKKAVMILKYIIDMTNETVGDAISDMLLVETILRVRDWSLRDWLDTYTELASKQTKVVVQDKNRIKTTNADTICTEPEGLQVAINEIVGEFPKARAFVRPSGTEDIVRIYVEATTAEHCDIISERIATKIKQLV